MKYKVFILILVVTLCCTMLSSCELLKFANHMLDIFGPEDNSSTDIDVNLNLSGGNHTHSWATIPGKQPTCTEAGYSESVKCPDCSTIYIQKETIPATGHKAESMPTVVEPTAGKDGRWELRCVVCFDILDEGVIPATGSVGLRYSKEGAGYAVSGIGACTDMGVHIPSEYNGAPVVGIAESAFADCQTIVDVKLPDTVTKIGSNAFYNCKSLASIYIPNSVKAIGISAFSECDAMIEIDLPSGLVGLSKKMFYGCDSLAEIVIPSSVQYLAESAFEDCADLEKLSILGEIDEIGASAFKNCKSLKTIEFFEVKSIGAYAFAYCSKLETVKFTGYNDVEWAHIKRDETFDVGTPEYMIYHVSGLIVKKDGTIVTWG